MINRLLATTALALAVSLSSALAAETDVRIVLSEDLDLHIMEADKQGYLRAYLILPSTIYGSATHELVDAGVSNGMSIQIPVLIKAALARKRAGVVGKGVALWPNVHIDDSAC